MRIKAKKINEKIAENYTKIKVGGIAEIIYGDNVIKCRNKFTRYLMSSIAVFVANSRGTDPVAPAGTYLQIKNVYVAGMSYGVTARVGTNTTTPTTPDMNDLVSKRDIAPNSITRRLIRGEGYELYIAEFVFVWNVGTLPDITVGELGVYLRTDNDDWGDYLVNPARATGSASPPNITGIPLGNADVRLASRIASADGAFDPFEFHGSIDSLTFKWRFQVAIV